jgi:hypothetical protein
MIGVTLLSLTPQVTTAHPHIARSNTAVCHTAGHYRTPTHLSCRVVYITACATIMMLLLAYCDSIIIHLTLRQHEMPFEDFKGLLEDGRYLVGRSGESSYFMVRPHCCLRCHVTARVLWLRYAQLICSNENCSLISNKIPVVFKGHKYHNVQVFG